MGWRDQIAKAILAGKPGGPWEGGIRAYHSSPHDFDRFDWSKLRTGEGANVYGSGFYFAENPAVSGQGGQYWQQFLPRTKNPELEAAQILRNNNFDRATAIEEVKGLVKHYDDKHSRDILKLLESGAPVGPRTYEVNINARPELMLDWDKPLKQQPVAETVRGLVPRDLRGAFDANMESGISGANAYYNYIPGERYSVSDVPGGPRRAVSARTADEALQMAGNDPRRLLHIRDPAYVSQTLAEAGIPGIRYLDQGSRNLKQPDLARMELEFARAKGDADRVAALEREIAAVPAPSYNYVVTDPSKLDIMAKYGIVGGAPIGMGAIAAQDRYQQ